MNSFAIPPSQLTSAELLGATDDLELIVKTVVEGFLHGLHQSPFVGFSVEFASHREYMPGDDLKHINWRLFGRHERLFVKEYDAETNVDVHLIVDASRSMTAEGKWSCAAMLAASLAHLARRQRDAVGLTLFADQVLTHLRPRSTVDHQMEILHALAQQRPHPASDSSRILHEVAELSPRRGLKVIISDFYFDDDELGDAIAHFKHYGHEVILVHVLTELEMSMPVSGPIRFRDLETGEEIVTQAEAIRDDFTAAVQEWQSSLRRIGSVYEVDYVPIHTNLPLPVALREYFKVRSELF
ncbi:DUF58 domain-containing protein [Aporhodopirellula aestuarii]|uniref:DUF58 domain-containing protein n=1 Tax=Aporhodopirellula aestuarii TaxID=2950107 RepID=A0ABT0U791_9BACT|nr:DUF58 domain-containing protein [Aporhodopirellula aestuarii]MCM2372768.1 DUF58 domain-containing protein [Aporhodopirellula aestuarii]